MTKKKRINLKIYPHGYGGGLCISHGDELLIGDLRRLR